MVGLVGFLALPFVVVPLLEIVVFVYVGGRIGVGALVALVVVTGILGFAIARSQGFAVWAQAQRALRRGAFPAKELAHGAMVLVGAVLLVTPGFVTDGVGFLLMVPAVREAVRRWGSRRFRARTGRGRTDVIDL